MIKKFNQYNESIRDQMVGKSEDEIIKNLDKGELESYNKIIELKDYIDSESDLNPHIELQEDEGEKNIYLNIELEYSRSNIQYIDGEYYIEIEEEINHRVGENTFEYKEEAFGYIYEEFKDALEGGLWNVDDDLKELTKKKTGIEKDLKKLKK